MNKTILLALFILLINGVTQAQDAAVTTTETNQRNKETADVEYGIASFYHDKFNGRQTANGELFSQKKLTAAHNNLPLGTWIRVTNLKNEKTVVVKVNDRLHRYNPRLLDLSAAAAAELGIKGDSLIRVKVEVLEKPRKAKKRTGKQ